MYFLCQTVSSSLQLHLLERPWFFKIHGKTWAGTESFVTFDYSSDSLLLFISRLRLHFSLGWDLLPKGRIWGLAKQHEQWKISRNNGLASELSNPQSAFKVTIPTHLPFPTSPLPPPSPNPSAITDISGYPWKFLFQQYFCEQIFACPPVHRKCIREASQLECGLSLNRCYEYCFAGFAQQ